MMNSFNSNRNGNPLHTTGSRNTNQNDSSILTVSVDRSESKVNNRSNASSIEYITNKDDSKTRRIIFDSCLVTFNFTNFLWELLVHLAYPFFCWYCPIAHGFYFIPNPIVSY